MVKYIKILAILLLAKVSLYGQFSYSNKVFHKHFQTCHFIGTTEEDLVLKLNADSTINIVSYTSSYHDQYNSVTRQMYFGTYSILGDTVKVNFISQSSKTKYKVDKTNTLYTGMKAATSFYANKYFPYPSTIYITSSDKIISTDSLFPTLPITTTTLVNTLESRFLSWDKYSNYKREIFGPSK